MLLSHFQSSRKTAESRVGSFEDLQNVDSKCAPDTDNITENPDDDLPEVTIHKSPDKSVDTNDKHIKIPDDDKISIHSNDSRLSCSPFSSPLQDITNTSIKKPEARRKTKVLNTSRKLTGYMDLTVMPDEEPKVKAGVINLSNVELNDASNKVLNKSTSLLAKQNVANDDDVTIIDSKPEIIALSSDDEEDVSECTYQFINFKLFTKRSDVLES